MTPYQALLLNILRCSLETKPVLATSEPPSVSATIQSTEPVSEPVIQNVEPTSEQDIVQDIESVSGDIIYTVELIPEPAAIRKSEPSSSGLSTAEFQLTTIDSF
ncbi:hypothetical protein SK128_017766 [Halocaridina rubra]|uniref:Uncharacterized protein n=1 Tax=Halocaridina rubra TaxID=373956 RepID=A0AAN8XME6_HALRR